MRTSDEEASVVCSARSVTRAILALEREDPCPKIRRTTCIGFAFVLVEKNNQAITRGARNNAETARGSCGTINQTQQSPRRNNNRQARTSRRTMQRAGMRQKLLAGERRRRDDVPTNTSDRERKLVLRRRRRDDRGRMIARAGMQAESGTDRSLGRRQAEGSLEVSSEIEGTT